MLRLPCLLYLVAPNVCLLTPVRGIAMQDVLELLRQYGPLAGALLFFVIRDAQRLRRIDQQQVRLVNILVERYLKESNG